MKRLMVIPAGYYQAPAIARLVQEGLWVVAADGNPSAWGLRLAHEAVVVDIRDPAQLKACAQEYRVEGILALNDWALEATAVATSELGLEGVEVGVVMEVRNKARLRNLWEAHSLSQPNFRVVASAQEAVRAGHEVGWPCIVKPDWSGGGGRGVVVVAEQTLMPMAYAYARKFALDGKVLVEEWMRGVESSVEGIVVDGQVLVLGISSKRHLPLAARIAKYLVYPPLLDASAVKQIQALAAKAVRAAGLNNCPFHLELITDHQGPRLVEMAPRPGGGHVFSHMVELASGVCFPAVAAELALGGRPSPLPREVGAGCYWFFYPPPGKLLEIRGVNKAKKMEGVVELGIRVTPGQEIGQATDSLARAGFVVTRGSSPQEALARATAVEEKIKFAVMPLQQPASQPSVHQQLTRALEPWLGEYTQGARRSNVTMGR